MNNKTRFALFSFLLAIAGCASQGSLDQVRNDVDAVKTRLYSVEKGLGGVREESKEGLGSVEKSFKSDVAAVRRLSADLQATIDSTKTEMRSLNGKVDDLALAIRKPSEDLARYREDADRRIIALEDRILKYQAAIDELNKKIAGLGQPKEIAPSPDAVYMKGLETFKAGDMPAARDLFVKFIELSPHNELAANAFYWIGETYYSEKNYEQAILSFQDVIKNYPQKEKTPAAMLKQAMAFRAINDTKSARFVLKKLAEGFPKTEEAKKARELLK
jgi:tol-pal system protein YbgF